MRITKALATLALIALSVQFTSAAYEEVECSTDSVFAENACSQCFTGGEVAAGDNIGLLTDDFVNNDSSAKLVFKEEQEMPEMIALSPSEASWSQTPSGDGFWEYTEAFNALYSEDEDGYILDANEKVTWLQSKLGYAYTLDTNTADAGQNIGLLVYKLLTHDVNDAGDVSVETNEHNECVLFTSKTTKTPPTTPEEPKELPETGAEHVILALIALLLGLGLVTMKRKA